MDTTQQVLDVIDKGGSVAIVVIIAIGLFRRNLVIGWQYQKVEDENKELRALLNQHATRTEARVDLLEQERDKRYGPPA